MGRKSNAKERIIAAAVRNFWDRSYGSVSVDNLCEDAGVNKGSVYHFFTSKSAIIFASIDAWWKDLQGSVIEPAFDPEIAPVQRIENLFRNMSDYQKQKQRDWGKVPGCPFCNLGSELSTRDDDLREKIDDIFDRYKVYLASALQDAREAGELNGDIENITDAVFGCLCGLILQAKIQDDPAIITNLIPNLRSLITNSGNNPPANDS